MKLAIEELRRMQKHQESIARMRRNEHAKNMEILVVILDKAMEADVAAQSFGDAADALERLI